MAVAWKDKKMKTLIASTGTTLPALKPAIKRRRRAATAQDATDSPYVNFEKYVNRPRIIESYFDAANAIDVHNHLRQGGLGLEKAWRTQWWHRVLATIIAMCETDAFIAKQKFSPLAHWMQGIKHRDFTENLALQLLTYNHEERILLALARKDDDLHVPRPITTPEAIGVNSHMLVSDMRASPYFIPRRNRKNADDEIQDGGSKPIIQRLCSVCKAHKTTFYCRACTEESHHNVTVCALQTTRPGEVSCLSRHIVDCLRKLEP